MGIALNAENQERKIKRNSPCLCGSGKKAKRCCLRIRELQKKNAIDQAHAKEAIKNHRSKLFIDGKYVGEAKDIKIEAPESGLTSMPLEREEDE